MLFAQDVSSLETDTATFRSAGTDMDSDGILDGDDNCIDSFNPDQMDTDSDGIGNVCDDDDDNDGVADENDAFPLDDSETLDTDADGTGNSADTDDDNDGISDATESSGPNSGDADNDGIQDSLQNTIACIKAYNAQGYIVLESPAGTWLSNCQATENPSPDDTPPGISFDYGFFDFTINGLMAGGNTQITITLPDNAVPVTYYKYGMTPGNQDDHWYEFMHDTQTGAVINGNVITLDFSDAERGDDVLIQDSSVIDLGAPGFDATAVDGDGNGGG